jgi:cell cycle arrest protein BUB2
MDYDRIFLIDFTLPSKDRSTIWSLKLIREQYISSKNYQTMIKRSEYHQKIINDSFRTMKSDKNFTSLVHHHTITRVLNAIVNCLCKEYANTSWRFSYVQGMNVTLAPFLYVMPELDAFNAYYKWVQVVCPTYIQPDLRGVHAGVKVTFIYSFQS